MQAKFVLTADAAKHDHLKGAWSSSISMYVGDWYTSGNNVYECILAHTSAGGNQPPNPTYWVLVIPVGTPLGSVSWKGAWSGATTYAAGDGCTYGGKAYVSIVGSNLNQVPPNISYWVEVYYSSAGDVVGPGSATASDVVEFDGTTGKLIKDGGLAHTNIVDAITKKHTQALDDNFNTLTAKTAFVDDDPLLIYSIADAAYRKMTLGNAKKLVLGIIDTTSTLQTITASTDTKIAAGLSATATIDTLSGWDGVNKKYICKEAGVYFMFGCAFFAGNITGDRRIHIRVNNVQVLEGVILAAAATSGWGQVTGVGFASLAVNDYVELYVMQTSGESLSCQYGNKLYLMRVG